MAWMVQWQTNISITQNINPSNQQTQWKFNIKGLWQIIILKTMLDRLDT